MISITIGPPGEVQELVTLYEGVTGPDQIHHVRKGYEVYTLTTTGTSYVVPADDFFQPAVVDTNGLHIESAVNIEFDTETQRLLNMGRKTKRAAAAGNVGSPTNTPKTGDSSGNFSLLDWGNHVVGYYDIFPANSNGDDYYDLNDTIMGSDSFSSDTQNDDKTAGQDADKQVDGDDNVGGQGYRSTGNATPESSQQGTPFYASSARDTPTNASPGDNVTDLMGTMDTPSAEIPSQVKLDLMQVRAAVEQAGGLVAQRPQNLDKMKPRTGQTLEILNRR